MMELISKRSNKKGLLAKYIENSQLSACHYSLRFFNTFTLSE